MGDFEPMVVYSLGYDVLGAPNMFQVSSICYVTSQNILLSCQSVPKKFLVKWEDVAKLVDTWEDKTTLPKRFPRFFFKDKKNLQGKNNMTTLVIQT